MLKKIQQYIKDNWKFIVFLVVFYLVMNYELPYVIYTPGGAINMSERVTGDNTYDESGSLSMTYVSMVKGSLPFLALSYVIPNWDIVSSKDISYDGDLKTTVEIDKIYMKEAISNAESVAYDKAEIEYSIKNTKNIVTYVDSNAKTKMHYGDEILEIDGNELHSLKELQDYVKEKNAGDIVKITYDRNGKKITEDTELIRLNDEAKVGISLALVSEYRTPYNIEVKTKSGESGPSGGLITALEIYNQITEKDITNGKKIMGTGTIDKDGTVGEIGGVKYKLIGAVKKGAEVFICPEENYEEARKVKEENKYNITILSAHTFDEAIEKLNSI